MIDRPVFVKDEYLAYLDELRESGQTNMYGAVPYLEDEFGFSKQDAILVLSYWMKSFEERHP
jgi:hypothetical protein